MGKTEMATPQLTDSVQIFNRLESEFVTAFRLGFLQEKTVVPIKQILFNSSAQVFTSVSIDTRRYLSFLMLIDLDVTSDPTDIQFVVEFSDDNATWYQYVIGPFGDLRYEDSAGDKTECLDGPIIAPYMRLRAVSSGCEATKTFLITSKLILRSK